MSQEESAELCPHAENKFKQQALRSFYPEHSQLYVTVTLLAVGILFLALGVSIVVSSDLIFEKDTRYDTINRCTSIRHDGITTISFNGTNVSQGCRARITFHISKTVAAPVFMSYRLVNFYQNYHKYQISRDDVQLRTGAVDVVALNCQPFRYPGELTGAADVVVNSSGMKLRSYNYNPCGSIAWSKFNDTINLYKVPDAAVVDLTSAALPANTVKICVGGAFTAQGDSTDSENQCTKTGIALAADNNVRFTSTVNNTNQWTSAGQSSSSDLFLREGYYYNEPGHKLPASSDEDFIVWARTAGMPDFRKLYRIIRTDLVPGNYLLDVQEYFDVASFNGEKHVVLSSVSYVGGKNYVMGISFLVMGSLSFVLASAFLVFAKPQPTKYD